MAAAFEVQVLIPVVGNDGVVFAAEHHAVWEGELVRWFGGFTVLPTLAVGAWRSEAGVVYGDQTRVYAVAVGSIARGAEVVSLVEFAKEHYGQEAICIRYLGVVEIL